MNQISIYLIVGFLVGLILLTVFLRLRAKQQNSQQKLLKLSPDVEKTLDAIGKVENLVDVDFRQNSSKIKFILKDTSIVNRKALKDLGATGFIEGTNTLTVLFGKVSSTLAEQIKQTIS